MKSKELSKKLRISKTTIAKLNENDKAAVKGGYQFTYQTTCTENPGCYWAKTLSCLPNICY